MISGQRGIYSSVPPSRFAKKCKVHDKLILRKIMEIIATRKGRGEVVEKCSDFGTFRGYISETVQDRR